MRDEAARARWRRRREVECVWGARAQSCGHVGRAGKCQCEHIRDRARHWGENRRDHRRGARHQRYRLTGRSIEDRRRMYARTLYGLDLISTSS